MTITMIMIVIIIISLFHLKEKWVPHMDNNNIKKYMYKRLSFKSAQQHTGKVKARHYSAKEKTLLQYYINFCWLSSKLIA